MNGHLHPGQQAILPILSVRNKPTARPVCQAAEAENSHLLRGWTPMPQEGRPECDYSVMISGAEKRRAADFWPIGLRDRLPVIPIPLRNPDAAAQVDLQEVLHRAYDGPGYEHFIYRGEPEPSLSANDAAWALLYVPATA